MQKTLLHSCGFVYMVVSVKVVFLSPVLDISMPEMVIIYEKKKNLSGTTVCSEMNKAKSDKITFAHSII